MKAIFSIMVMAAALLLSPGANSQEQKDVAAMLKSQNYTFFAETVSPMASRTRHLTSRYVLRVTTDTIEADLPYFGRSYSPTYNMAGGGIDFTSVDFDYATVKKKKKRWEIIIRPNDAGDVQELNLTVFENGRADLRVTSNSRQAIRYSGYIE